MLSTIIVQNVPIRMENGQRKKKERGKKVIKTYEIYADFLL